MLSAAVPAGLSLFSFCAYLQQQFFNGADGRAEQYKISAQQQALPLAAMIAN